MQDLSRLLSDFQKARLGVDQFLKQDLPRIMGVEAKKIVLQNFALSGYDDGISFTAWPKRAASTDAQYDRGRTVNAKTGKLSKYRTGKNSTFKGSVYNSANPLLIQTRTMIDSIHYRISNGAAWIGVSGTFTGINNKKSGNIATYAEANNFGTDKIPRRKFMPFPTDTRANPKIMKAISKKTEYEIANRMKLFKK